MRKFSISLFVLLTIIINHTNVYAIAVDDYTVAEESPSNVGYNLDISYIYHYKGASAVAIDHYWLLTAAHIGDNGGTGELIINGETFTQQEVVFHDQADLALVRFDKPFPGYYFIDGIINHKAGGFWGTTTWYELIMAGYGYDGNVGNDYFTQGSSYGVLRWGTNRGTKEETEVIDVGESTGMRTSSCFTVEFDLNDTDYEAGGNIRDSGGAVFATNSIGEWALAGIIAYRAVNNDANGTGNAAVKISDYTNWIKSIIIDYDSDKDFLPDWWEEKYSGSTTSMDAEADEDNDHSSNYEEWIANTVPTNGMSFFHITASTFTNIVFISSSNREFCVEYKDSLTATGIVWQIDGDWAIGDDTETSKPIISSVESRFYRVRAKLP